MKHLIIIWGIAIYTSIGLINAAHPSTEENCIELTPEKEKVINDTIDKITIFLSKIQEELDDIDIRILRVDIDKHSNQEREEKDLKLKITINDCEENYYTDYDFNKKSRHHHKHNKNAYQPDETDDVTFDINQTSDMYKTDKNTAKNNSVEETTTEHSNVQRGDSSSDAINSDTSYGDEEVPMVDKELDNNNHAQKRRHRHHRKHKHISDTAIFKDNIPEHFDYNEFVTSPEMVPVTYDGESNINKATKRRSKRKYGDKRKHHTPKDDSRDTKNNNPNESGPSRTVYDEYLLTSVDKNDATVKEDDLPAKRYYKHRHHKRKHDYINVDQFEVTSEGIYNSAVIEEASTPIYPNLKEVEVKFDNTAVAYDDIQRPIKSKNHHKKKHPRRLFDDHKVIVTRSENLDEFDTAFVMDSPLPHYLNYQNSDQTNNFPTDYSLKTENDKGHLSKHHHHKSKHPGLTASSSAIAEAYEQDSAYPENNSTSSDNDRSKGEIDKSEVPIDDTVVIDDETRQKNKRHHHHHKHREQDKNLESNYPKNNDSLSESDNDHLKEKNDKSDILTDDIAVINDETRQKNKRHHHHHKHRKPDTNLESNYPEDRYISPDSDNDRSKGEIDKSDVPTDDTAVIDDETRPKNKRHHHHHKHRKQDTNLESIYPEDRDISPDSDNDRSKGEIDKSAVPTNDTAVIDDETRLKNKRHHPHYKNRKNDENLDSNYPEDRDISPDSDNDRYKKEIYKSDVPTDDTAVIDDETRPKNKRHHPHHKNRKNDDNLDSNYPEDRDISPDSDNDRNKKEIYKSESNYPNDSEKPLDGDKDQFKEETYQKYDNFTDETPLIDDETRPKHKKHRRYHKHRKHDKESELNYPKDTSYSGNNQFTEETGNKDDTIDGKAIFYDEARPNHKRLDRHHKNREHTARPVSNYPADNNTALGDDNNQFKKEIDNKNGTNTGHTEVIDDETQQKHTKHHRRPKNKKYYEEIGDHNEEDIKRSKSPDDEVIVRDDELNNDMRRRHRKKKPHRNFTFDDFIRYLEENKDDGKEKCVCVQGLQDW